MKILAPILIFSAVFLVGCVTPTRVDYDRAAAGKLNSYRSFAVDDRETRSSYQDVVLSPIVDRRIERAIHTTLHSKSLNMDPANPDFRVTFNTVTRTKSEIRDLGVGPSPFRRHPYYGYSGFNRIDLVQYEEGTFLIDIIDNASKELVWRGAYTKRLGWSAPTDEEVAEIVEAILKNFPPSQN